MNDVVRILKREGPSSSSHVAATLASELALSAETARKRVERRPAGVRVLAGLNLDRGAKFMYLESQYGTPRFWDNLIAALDTGTYGRALAALRARGGMVPVGHFGIACGAPFSRARQVGTDELRKRLVDVRLLEELDVPGVGPCIAFAKNLEHLVRPAEEMRARLIVEKVLLSNVKEWARRLNLGAYESFVERDEGHSPPHVGTFFWDMTAPSYLGGLATWAKDTKPVNGFLVFDILLNGEVDAKSLMPFVHKCVTLRTLKKVPRCMQFFIAERYSYEAFAQARTYGIVPATPASLFGEDVARALLDLATLLKSAASTAVDPVKFAELFDRLGKVEGAAGTLRGALFEFVAAEIVRKSLRPTRLTLNKVFRESSKDAAEVDVLAELENDRVHFIECKGKLPGVFVANSDIEAWLTRRVPYLYKFARQRHPEWNNLALYFELWTTGEISAEALRMIEERQSSVSSTRYTIVIRRADELRQMAHETGDVPLREVLSQHFLRHPLAEPSASVPVSQGAAPAGGLGIPATPSGALARAAFGATGLQAVIPYSPPI